MRADAPKKKQTNIKQTNKQSNCWKLIIIINFILRIKEQETHLILHEHDDDDVDDNIHTHMIETTSYFIVFWLNSLNPELNPICYLLALLAHHFLHVSRIRVNSLTIRLLMSYIYMEHLLLMFLDHTQRRSTVGRTPLDE